MITAKLAKRDTDMITREKRVLADKWAQEQLSILETETLASISEGLYTDHYVWHKSTFPELGITRPLAAKALQTALEGLGFRVDIAMNYYSAGDLCIIWSWDEVE